VDGLALYGAIVGSVSILLAGGSLGWQIYTWRRDRGTKVEVKLSNAILGLPIGPTEAVIITAINHSRHPIRINSTGLELQDGSRNWSILPYVQAGAGLPGTIQPNDSADTWWFLDDIKKVGIDLRKPLVAKVVAGNDQRFRSKPQTLRTG
jgi:hypothetical protein